MSGSFKVRLAISGFTTENVADFARSLEHEITMRQFYAARHRVDYDIEAKTVTVEFDDDANSERQAIAGAREELREIIPALIFDYAKIHLELVGVSAD